MLVIDLFLTVYCAESSWFSGYGLVDATGFLGLFTVFGLFALLLLSLGFVAGAMDCGLWCGGVSVIVVCCLDFVFLRFALLVGWCLMVSAFHSKFFMISFVEL